jgi:hypothetical protein
MTRRPPLPPRSTISPRKRASRPRDPVGRRRARRGYGHVTSRPVRARRLRPHACTGSRCGADRRISASCPATAVRGPNDGCGREPKLEWLHEHELLVEAGTIRHRYPSLALPHVARLPSSMTGSSRRRDPAADAGRQQRGVAWPPQYKRMDDWLRNMGGGIAAALAGSAAVLSLRLRTTGRDRLAGGVPTSARSRGSSSSGAAPPLDRRGDDSLRGLRRGGDAHRGGRRRLARRGHRSLLDARVAEPGVGAGGECDRRGSWGHPRRPAGPRVLGGVVSG